MRYSAESTILPTTAHDLLEWAAAHIEARGFHDGRDGDRFGHDRSTTTTCLLTPGIIGALDVAGGDGRRASARTYDYPALYAAQRLALDTLADLVVGGAVSHDLDWVDQTRYRRAVVHTWAARDGRTPAEVVTVLREAAGITERAADARVRLVSPPAPTSTATVLEAAAAHIEAVGHRPGMETHDPAGYSHAAACTMLHTLDVVDQASRPIPGDAPRDWDAYREASVGALRAVAEYVKGQPIVTRDGDDEWATRRRMRGTVLVWANRPWGDQPGRSTADVVAAFRAAVPAVVGGDDVLEVPAEPGQAAFL
jgi:hypothetical protein